MKTKYANTELKCGSTIPGDTKLLSPDEINDAVDAMLRDYIFNLEAPTYSITIPTNHRLYGVLNNVSVD